MTVPLPGVAIPEGSPVPSTRPETELTTLPNGVKIATEATPVRVLIQMDKQYRRLRA
jgi:hypothetical protein